MLNWPGANGSGRPRSSVQVIVPGSSQTTSSTRADAGSMALARVTSAPIDVEPLEPDALEPLVEDAQEPEHDCLADFRIALDPCAQARRVEPDGLDGAEGAGVEMRRLTLEDPGEPDEAA